VLINKQLAIYAVRLPYRLDLTTFKECIVNGKGSTVYEISKRLFVQELDEFDLRIAMTETLAHLMYLVYRGELEILEHKGVNLFMNPECSQIPQ